MVCGIRKSSFFTEHLRTTASAFSFSEATTEALYEKRCSWKLHKFHRKAALVGEIFKNTFFYGTPLDDCFWLFHIFFLSVSKDNQILSILEWQKTIFNDSFDLIIFIFQQGKSLMMEREFLAEVVEPTTGLMLLFKCIKK